MPNHVSSNRSRRSKKRPKRLVLSRVNQGTGEAGEEEDDDEEDEEDSEGITEDVVNVVNATRGVLFEEEEDDGDDEDVDEEGEKDPEEQDEVAVDADRGNHIIGSMPYSVSRSSTRTRLRTRMDNATLPMTTVATQSLLPGELNLLEPGLRLVPMLGPFPSAPPAELVKSFEEVSLHSPSVYSP
ncbi:unnamed protein product [Protopolystoma xenopodis]|uniref:Uncharacterized protein n=1 Tax=Protopolystoma xenopodis TaxID=117903 RepID=A0A3S5CL36_9PLAT|nr:unnamed protein product [Protopolystoma xenopodis]